MVRKSSNRDRIAKLAAEKAAGEAEKKAEKKAATKGKKKPAKKTTKKATTKGKKKKEAAAAAAKSVARMRLVWLVCDHAGNPVKTYTYPQKDDAYKEAARLSEKKGKLHFVKKDREPME